MRSSMRRLFLLVPVVLLVPLACVALFGAREPSPPYEMKIRRIDDGARPGIVIECVSGCDFVTLKGSCDADHPDCTYVVSQNGIRVMPDPAAAQRK